MLVDIRDDIPFPKKVKVNHNYPFGTIAVGESFLMESTCLKTAQSRTYMESKNRKPKLFRCLPEGEQYRVWRVQ
jgi:hypothetical protein